MDALEGVVLIGAAILAAYVVAPRLRVATPVVLLVVGVLLGVLPQLRATMIPPELVLLVLLPVLLYWESLTTSLREIRHGIVSISLMSTALVVATAASVAVTAHAFGIPWGPAWVLGAAVAPTDATAIAALSRMLPRRQLTVLRAESLINDGTALVIFGVAVGVTVGEQTLTPGGVAGQVLLAYGGGAAVGAAVAWVNIQLRRRLEDPLLGNLVMILAPFGAFLVAELIHASGVIAVVVSGLIMSQAAPRVIRAQHRSQALAFWPLLTFLINAVLFVFVGIELQTIGGTFTGPELAAAVGIVLVVSAVVIATRFLFVFGSFGFQRLLARVTGRASSVDGARVQVINSLAGFRGAVSLAVALSVPELLGSGAPFPSRDLIVFVTGGVVLITLVGQALALPFAVRAARLPPETDVEREFNRAAVTTLQGARDAIPELADRVDAGEPVTSWLREEYETYLGSARSNSDEEITDVAAQRNREGYVKLSLALIEHRRDGVIRLRDEGVIDDTVLRRLQAGLDREELRHLDPEPLE
ncbi:Na+/H+ antiporter [Microbacterium sp. PMB16]|uniref:Na+/H+ antiporter n=1 Tax=Microbacterium sp. PMB16 TaxID=3120157 RepID=UPI003F4BB7BB